MFETIREDAMRYRWADGSRPWQCLTYPGFWITLTYRFGHWGAARRSRLLRRLLHVLHVLLAFPWKACKNVDLPASAVIGGGLRMVHPHSILIPNHVEIGSGVSVYHEVTFGTGPIPGVPKVGNNVMIYPGAKLLGGITVGDNVYIGANAVLTKDAPDNSTVAAPLSRVIPSTTTRAVRDVHRKKQSAPSPQKSVSENTG